MTIDLQPTSTQLLTRIDGILLLLEAQNHLLLREDGLFLENELLSLLSVHNSTYAIQNALWLLRRNAVMERNRRG